jgi:hypothetical protein
LKEAQNLNCSIPFFFQSRRRQKKENRIQFTWCLIVSEKTLTGSDGAELYTQEKNAFAPKKKKHPNHKKIPRDVQRQTQQMHAEKKGDPKKQSRVVEDEEEEEERTSLVLSHKYRSFQETTDSETASELSNCE